MPFDMKCNMCGVTLRVQEDQVGSIVNCPSCGQVIFVQPPTEASAARDRPPELLETRANHSGTSDAESPDFLSEAETAAPVAPELAPQALAETDTVSSLAEMFGSEESSETAATKEPPSSFTPQAEAPESIDLSFLTPKLDTPITLDSGPATQSAPEPAPGASGMPWEPPAENSTVEATAQSIFEPEQTAAPWSPRPVASSTAEQPLANEFPWMAPSVPNEPVNVPTPSPGPFDFTTTAIPSQPTAAQPAAAATPPTFIPPATPVAAPAQPEFFLPNPMAESISAAAPTVDAAFVSAAPIATSSAKPASRFGVMAAVYVSGVIFGLIIGKFVFGRAAAAGPTPLEAIRDDGMLKDKTKWVDPKTAVPSGQLKRLGETVQIAGLAITARSVERAKVTKVHSFGGSKESSHGECLVLHLRLKNTSKDVEFAPLDPMFVRPHHKRERPTYSYIELPGGEPIGMFDLHKFSEFDLEGQPFDVLKPGEEIEALIAAAEDSPAQAKGTMRWRVQVRAGVPDKKAYTTVVGFEFTPEQIKG